MTWASEMQQPLRLARPGTESPDPVHTGTGPHPAFSKGRTCRWNSFIYIRHYTHRITFAPGTFDRRGGMTRHEDLRTYPRRDPLDQRMARDTFLQYVEKQAQHRRPPAPVSEANQRSDESRIDA